MRRTINEDGQMMNISREVNGMSDDTNNPGSMRPSEYIARKNNIPQSWAGKPYPIEHLEQTLADVFVDVANLQKLIEIAAENPALKGKEEPLEGLSKLLKQVANILVDFDNGLSIIKSNEQSD